MRSRGFTMMEVLIAAVIMLVVGGVAIVFLLNHIDRSIVAGAMEDYHNIKAALVSAMTDGTLADADNDGDYIDDLIANNKLSHEPTVIPDATYHALKSEVIDGVEVFYIAVECDDGADHCYRIVEKLDEEVDGGDGPNAGQIQWVDS